MTDCFLIYDHININDRDYMVLACIREDDRRLVYIRYDDPEHTSVTGNVYVARIDKRVPGVGIFLTATDGMNIFVKEANCHDAFYIIRQSQKKELSAGDLILVQIVRDAIKTKEPEGRLDVTLKTPDLVMTGPGEGTGVSKKLPDDKRQLYSAIRSDGNHLLIRTAAGTKSEDEIRNEVSDAGNVMGKIFSDALNHTRPALIWSDDDLCNRLLSSFPLAGNDLRVTRIMTSDKDICDRLGKYGSLFCDEGISLPDLYRIRTITDDLLKKKVWMKDGANIVIEQTEALVSIDVNSAKSKKVTSYSVNIEAAAAIMEQLRLRNLSGIIIIDFMKMHTDRERSDIISLMKSHAIGDYARVRIEGFTKLGLLEMTREKKGPSLQEITGGKRNVPS